MVHRVERHREMTDHFLVAINTAIGMTAKRHDNGAVDLPSLLDALTQIVAFGLSGIDDELIRTELLENVHQGIEEQVDLRLESGKRPGSVIIKRY